MTTLTEMTVYRCTTCGKWSHAKTRPLSHQRFVSGDEIAPDSAIVIREIPASFGHGESYDPGGWMVRCGPFETWRAERVA